MTDPVIHLVCGPCGTGKTTYAIALAARLGGVRFSIDEWMTTLFWMDAPRPIEFAWAMERVNRCEAQIWSMALQVAGNGTAAVLDLGLLQRAHRRKLLDLAAAACLGATVHVLELPAAERWQRVERRNREKGETYSLQVTRELFDFVETMWEPPGDDEGARVIRVD